MGFQFFRLSHPEKKIVILYFCTTECFFLSWMSIGSLFRTVKGIQLTCGISEKSAVVVALDSTNQKKTKPTSQYSRSLSHWGRCTVSSGSSSCVFTLKNKFKQFLYIKKGKEDIWFTYNKIAIFVLHCSLGKLSFKMWQLKAFN